MHNMFIPTIIVSLFLFYAGFEGFDSYATYALLGIFVCVISAITAFGCHAKRQQFLTWLFIIIAVLFNPVIEIHFSREVWDVIDIVSAVVFSVSAYFDWQKKRKQQLPPEVRRAFDNMIGVERPSSPSSPSPLTIENLPAMFINDMKKDIILLGYHKDFYALPKDVQNKNKEDFEEKINIIKNLSPDKIERLLSLRKQSHNDLYELSNEVHERDKKYRKEIMEGLMKRAEERENKKES